MDPRANEFLAAGARVHEVGPATQKLDGKETARRGFDLVAKAALLAGLAIGASYAAPAKADGIHLNKPEAVVERPVAPEEMRRPIAPLLERQVAPADDIQMREIAPLDMRPIAPLDDLRPIAPEPTRRPIAPMDHITLNTPDVVVLKHPEPVERAAKVTAVRANTARRPSMAP